MTDRIDWGILEEIAEQRRKGWPDFHPEDYCHRCGHKNVSWYIDAATWNRVVPEGDPWNGIICIPCFIGRAEVQDGQQAWRITRDQYGSEALEYLPRDRMGAHAMTEPIPIPDQALADLAWRVGHYGGTHLWPDDWDGIRARIDQAETERDRLRAVLDGATDD